MWLRDLEHLQAEAGGGRKAAIGRGCGTAFSLAANFRWKRGSRLARREAGELRRASRSGRTATVTHCKEAPGGVGCSRLPTPRAFGVAARCLQRFV